MTKDPLFAQVAAARLFSRQDLTFPFSRQAVTVNNAKPLVSVSRISAMLGGELAGRNLLLMGVSYRQDVDDTRESPARVFVETVRARKGNILLHDPLVRHWPEMNLEVPADLPSPETVDGIVVAVPHEEYRRMDFLAWLKRCRPAVLDANNVLSADQRADLRAAGCPVESIGRGNPG